MNQAPSAPAKEQVGAPPVDLVREGNALVLTASLPGLRAGDFRISIVGSRQVYIEGAVPYQHPLPVENLMLAEREYGPFSRTVNLPLPVDPGAASVHFERGVLTARLPLQLQKLPLHWAKPEAPRRE